MKPTGEGALEPPFFLQQSSTPLQAQQMAHRQQQDVKRRTRMMMPMMPPTPIPPPFPLRGSSCVWNSKDRESTSRQYASVIWSWLAFFGSMDFRRLLSRVASRPMDFVSAAFAASSASAAATVSFLTAASVSLPATRILVAPAFSSVWFTLAIVILTASRMSGSTGVS